MDEKKGFWKAIITRGSREFSMEMHNEGQSSFKLETLIIEIDSKKW